jgi:hypothetical protein
MGKICLALCQMDLNDKNYGHRSHLRLNLAKGESNGSQVTPAESIYLGLSSVSRLVAVHF